MLKIAKSIIFSLSPSLFGALFYNFGVTSDKKQLHFFRMLTTDSKNKEYQKKIFL